MKKKGNKPKKPVSKSEKFYMELFKELDDIEELYSDDNEINNSKDLLKYPNEKCPRCGALLVEQPIRNIQTEGVGITVSISSKPYSVATEILCPNCGLVDHKDERWEA